MIPVTPVIQHLCGFGRPHSDLVNTYPCTNVSRIQDRLDCEQLYVNRHLAGGCGRVPLRREVPALDVGTAWHSALESLRMATEWSLEAVARIARVRAEMLGREADSIVNSALAAKKLLDGARWISYALPAYHQHYSGAAAFPIREVLATEQECWILSDGVLVMGKLDLIGTDELNRVIHLQYKTVPAGTNFTTYLLHQRIALHDPVYGSMISALYPDREYGGSFFDLAAKLTPTDGLHRKVTEEQVKAWPSRAFHRSPINYSDSDLTEALSRVTRKAKETVREKPERNPGACKRWGRLCDYARVCTGFDQLEDDSLFMDKPVDYVSEAAGEETEQQ